MMIAYIPLQYRSVRKGKKITIKMNYQNSRMYGAPYYGTYLSFKSILTPYE